MRKGIAAAGDDRAVLAALRDRLASNIDKASNPYVVAALGAQLVRTISVLADMKVPAAGSRVDELRRQRDRRRAALDQPKTGL
jgi:hypothetical protein